MDECLKSPKTKSEVPFSMKEDSSPHPAPLGRWPKFGQGDGKLAQSGVLLEMLQ